MAGKKTLVGSVEAEFLHTPGHTKGSVCIMMDNILFTGDTLFAGDVGRTDLPGGDPDALRRSLRLLYTLPHDYIVYPGHGGADLARHRARYKRIYEGGNVVVIKRIAA